MAADYYKKKESVDEYIKMAEGINGSNIIDKLGDYLHDNADLLELGSGPGSDWEILSKKYKVVGSDFSLEFLKRLEHKYPNNCFLEVDAETIETDLKFNAVYSNKVLIHLDDESLRKSIVNQANVLLSNGIVCHSFWKGDGSEIYKEMLVNYQNKESLEGLFGDLFEVLLIEEYNEFEDNDSVMIIARLKA